MLHTKKELIKERLEEAMEKCIYGLQAGMVVLKISSCKILGKLFNLMECHVLFYKMDTVTYTRLNCDEDKMVCKKLINFSYPPLLHLYFPK